MTQEKNNFKKLEQEELAELDKIEFTNISNKVKNKIDGNTRLVRLIGDIFSLYLPKLVDTLTDLLGNDDKSKNQ